jgi:hypothetical protein
MKTIQKNSNNFSFDVNIENPFSLIHEECQESVDSHRRYPGSNTCGITDINGALLPWGRSPLEEDPEYLCIGCSCTVAMGLLEDYSWPAMLRKLTGAKVNNLSSPGSGIDFLCSLAIDSFVKYGKPKKIYALFPDLYRLWTLSPTANNENEKAMTHTIHASWHTDINEYFLDVRHSFISGLDRPDTANPMRFKNYLNEKTSFPPDLAIFHSLSTLDILINYCALNEIDFRFASWENNANSTFSKLGHYSTNYRKAILSEDLIESRSAGALIASLTDLDSDWWEDDLSLRKIYGAPWRRMGLSVSCNHQPQTEYQHKWWSVAGDIGEHPGIHDQVHFLEHLSGMEVSNDFLAGLP